MDLESLKERLSFLFNKNFSERDELGASVSIWIQGEEAISFSKGYCDKERSKKWDDSTLVPVWSATKGLAAACVLKVLESHNVNLESKVSDIWPEFSQSGKAEITFEQLLSHRAAIPAIDESVSIFDYDQVIKAIEVQCPLWKWIRFMVIIQEYSGFY